MREYANCSKVASERLSNVRDATESNEDSPGFRGASPPDKTTSPAEAARKDQVTQAARDEWLTEVRG